MREPNAAEEEVLRYLTELRSWLRLDQWDIILHEPETDPDLWASVTTSDNHWTASLYMNWDRWATATPEQKCNTLLHELIHLAHRTVTDVWSELASSPALSAREGEAADDRWHLQMERFVSWVTGQIQQRPDIPSWPGTGEIGRGLYLLGNEPN